MVNSFLWSSKYLVNSLVSSYVEWPILGISKLNVCLKSPVSRLFAQPFAQAQLKENIKVLHHCPLRGEFTGEAK